MSKECFSSSKECFSSTLITIGGCFCVAAGAIASTGSAGLNYMNVNDEALHLVAGCAIFGVAILTIGVCLIYWGVHSKFKLQNTQILEMETRISNIEINFNRQQEMDSIVRLHEDAEYRRNIEDRIKDLFSQFENSQQKHRNKIDVLEAELHMENSTHGTRSTPRRRIEGEDR